MTVVVTGSFDYEKFSRFGIAEVVGSSNPTLSISFFVRNTVLNLAHFGLLEDKFISNTLLQLTASVTFILPCNPLWLYQQLLLYLFLLH